MKPHATTPFESTRFRNFLFLFLRTVHCKKKSLKNLKNAGHRTNEEKLDVFHSPKCAQNKIIVSWIFQAPQCAFLSIGGVLVEHLDGKFLKKCPDWHFFGPLGFSFLGFLRFFFLRGFGIGLLQVVFASFRGLF